MFVDRCIVRGGSVAAVLLFLAGCAPSAYVVKPPAPSGLRYEIASPPARTTLALVDGRRPDERDLNTGLLKAELSVGDAPIDPPAFLANHLQQEFASRGLPVQVSRQGQTPPVLRVTTFRIQNHRVSGFSPFVTFTFLSTDLDTGTAKKRIGVFIKRGKVPVWSFDEIVDPTFNQPLSLAVKELASKVANQMYGYRASDKTVDDLVAKLSGKREPESFLDVYALGFTNNPKAIEPVAKLTTDPDEYVRLAAISSLGNLRATSHFDFLKGIYQNRSSLWQDRAMALKSIADLDTNEAKAFVTGELKYWQAQPPSNESTWTSQIIRLYY